MSTAPTPDEQPDNGVELLEEDNQPSSALNVFQQEPSDAPSNEDRLRVLKWLVLLVSAGGVALMLAAFLSSEEVWTRVERASTFIVSPLLALLGTAIGWYFGKHSK